ncbi:MAG: hypothetical protein JST41_07795 [Bacteroidetes bacterium]|jgi:hypothetical protein|nr:hypothetical protein [Bacteroidota bacterium]MCC6654891.1 hypothetical protein [Flavobacteriales bacterium]HMU13126.1 hypothetical protein [Flavobacteriales bacterium]
MFLRQLPALVALPVILGSCGSPLKTMSLSPPAEKHTVAFWSAEQWRGEPAPFQYAIAQGFRSQDAENYFCRLVEPDLDSVRTVIRKKGACIPKVRSRSSLRRNVQQFACAAGVDHVIHTSVSEEFKMIMLAPAEQQSLFGKVFLGKRDKPALFGPTLSKLTFTLKYFDGRTGRTLWKTRVYFRGHFRGFDHMNEIITKKVHKRFPYRKDGSLPSSVTP